MKKTTRRDALKSLVVGGAAAAAAAAVAAPAAEAQAACASRLRTDWSDLRWGKGFEGQRIADLGDGTSSTRCSPATAPTPPSSRTATTTG